MARRTQPKVVVVSWGGNGFENDGDDPLAICPHCHAAVRGTVELCPGSALANFTRNEDGTADYEHEGETEMFWDGQETQTEDGEVLVDCHHGCEFKLSEIVWLEPGQSDLRIFDEDFRPQHYGMADYSKPRLPVDQVF